MKMKKISKFFIILCLILTSTNTFAQEIDYKLEFFNQLADKVTSLYLKEAIVGLDVVEDIYGDEKLLENIENRLNKDYKTKEYLLDRGFNEEKIKEIMLFINDIFPTVENITEKDKNTENIIKQLIVSTLVEKDATLNYSKYEKDISALGTEFYNVMPKGVKDTFEQHFKTDCQKSDAMIKILVEYIYSGHGRGVYDIETKDYINLSLRVDDEFIKNVNKAFGFELLNEDVKKSLNIFLGGLEDTIKQEKLDRVYSDLASVLNLIDTNITKEQREENMETDFEDTRVKDDLEQSSVREKNINRAEILKLSLSMIKLEPKKYDGEFKDIEKDDFYADYIATGKSIGLISGYKDNTFRPKSKVTRSEMMSIISNSMNYVYGEVKLTESEIEFLLRDFKYRDNIEVWAREHTAKLVHLNLIDRNYTEKFGEDELVTRSEAMSLIDKINIH